MESQKVVKLTIFQCNFNVLRGVPASVERFLRNRQKLMESQKVVKLTICQCDFNVLRGVPASVERFLRNRQNLSGEVS